MLECPVLAVSCPSLWHQSTGCFRPKAVGQRVSSAAAGEERSDETDVGWSDLLGVAEFILERLELGRSVP